MVQQLFFDLDFSPVPKNIKPDTLSTRSRRLLLQRAVLRWLEETSSPTGSALDVVTRISRLRADVAAFWSVPMRNPNEEGPTQLLTPDRTVIVQCHVEREECWPDCIRSREILPQLRQLKTELQETESRIREEEPGLRDNNALFEEYAEWRYEKTANREYHQLKRAIEKMEHGLYHGTKFERIRSAQLADRLYLAVPAGVVEEKELADGWGLIWIEDDLSVRVVAEPEDRACLPLNRMHLVQNIAAAAKNSELLCRGIHQTGEGTVVLTRPLTRRRAEEKPRLSEA